MKFMGWLTCALAVACYLIGLADVYWGEYRAGMGAFIAAGANGLWWFWHGRERQ